MTAVDVIREVDPSARIASDAFIGPFCVVGPGVSVGSGTRLERRVTLTGRTTVGADNVFEEGCTIGGAPQDLKYAGGSTILVIGSGNRFGRCATAHIGTEGGGRLTRVGNNNVVMAGSHVAHDCYVDDDVTLGRGVLLAGHVRVESGAVAADFSAVHHFVTIGRYARVRARTPVRRDVPPYTDFYAVDSDWSAATVQGIHDAGVRAAELDPLDELDLRLALQELFEDEAALQTKIEHLVTMGAEGEVARLCEFCQRSLRGTYGRHREVYRGQDPPEAQAFFASGGDKTEGRPAAR